MKARYRLPGGSQSKQVTLISVMPEGCRFREPNGRLQNGTALALTFDTIGPVNAVVRWASNQLIDCVFERPLYAPVVEHLSGKIRQAEYSA